MLEAINDDVQGAWKLKHWLCGKRSALRNADGKPPFHMLGLDSRLTGRFFLGPRMVRFKRYENQAACATSLTSRLVIVFFLYVAISINEQK